MSTDRAQSAPVHRVASVVRLLPEHEAEYRRLHTDVWPAVLDTLRRVGVRNYSIFLRDGLLLSYLEHTGDWAQAQAQIAADPETQRWWQLTDPMQQPVASAADGEWWAPAEEVFHLD